MPRGSRPFSNDFYSLQGINNQHANSDLLVASDEIEINKCLYLFFEDRSRNMIEKIEEIKTLIFQLGFERK